MKLDFEIAVDQQTRAHDQTFDGVPDSGCPPVPAGQPRPYHLNMLTTMLWGALLVATTPPPPLKAFRIYFLLMFALSGVVEVTSSEISGIIDISGPL